MEISFNKSQVKLARDELKLLFKICSYSNSFPHYPGFKNYSRNVDFREKQKLARKLEEYGFITISTNGDPDTELMNYCEIYKKTEDGQKHLRGIRL